MSVKSVRIQNRAELFDFLQSQMNSTYDSLLDEKRLTYENNLVKSYIIETDIHRTNLLDNPKGLEKFIKKTFVPVQSKKSLITVSETEEAGFFELILTTERDQASIFVDASTNPRFWLVYSLSQSRPLDWWLEKTVSNHPNIDFVWLWADFLEGIQSRGIPRGFGLDYDYRRFDREDSEITTYLKMQLWGGQETQAIYKSLQNNELLDGKIVLSKIRVKIYRDLIENLDHKFAIEEIKYTGKFTARGTDFETHNLTLNQVRSKYAEVIAKIEREYALGWKEVEKGGIVLEGFAFNFIPRGFQIPVEDFCQKVFTGAHPFKLFGFVNIRDEFTAVVDVVDLHTGGELSFEIYPDLITVYLPQTTCGNTIARFYTNLQHFFNVNFDVETDNGEQPF